MARSIQIAILILSVVFFLSYLNGAQGHAPHFYVEGKVYCDTCRAQFLTRLSEKLPGAKVKLECKEMQGGKVLYTTEGETDANAMYKLRADGEFADDICEVSLVSSPKPDCSEMSHERNLSSTITLTTNAGMADKTRRPNPLLFMKNEPLDECANVYKEMDIHPPKKVCELFFP